jgi:gamma-glutamylcyclotransferase
MPQRSKRLGGRAAAAPRSGTRAAGRPTPAAPVAAKCRRSAAAAPAAIMYFAYGSNLDLAQMRERCPSARKEARAVLHGYAIAFGGWSARWGGAVASIVPVRGSRVEGLLYRIDRADLHRLDQFEGCPFAYERLTKLVTDERERELAAHVYLQTAADFEETKLPSRSYFKKIANAYARLGFSFEPLAAAVGIEL